MSKKAKQSPQQRASLRVCASCEWIYHTKDAGKEGGCPKCGFASYGARFVYGDKAYRYAESQKPWFDRRMADHAAKLHAEIAASMPKQTFRGLAAKPFKE